MEFTKVKKFQLYNIWNNKETTDLDFSKQVTFLTGFNGVGKSTLLETLFISLQENHIGEPNMFNWSSLCLLENNIKIFQTQFESLTKEIHKKINENSNRMNADRRLSFTAESFHKLINNGINTKTKTKTKTNHSITMSNTKSDEQIKGSVKIVGLPNNDLFKGVKIAQAVRPILYREEAFLHPAKPYMNVENDTEKNLLSKNLTLNFTLRELLIDFLSQEKVESESKNNVMLLKDADKFISALRKKIPHIDEGMLKSAKEIYINNQIPVENPSSESIISIFEDEINEFFSCTHKTITRDARSFIAFKDSHQNIIEWADLSRGEKNLLCLLLLAFAERDHGCVFILDEPDLSLHIEWQQRLVSSLLKLSPKSQFIIATHSPAMFMNDEDFEVIHLEG
jgi:predicted ATPase